TNGIVYLDLGFDLHTLEQMFLPYVKLFGRALLETGTADASPVQLQQRIGRETGGIHANSFASSVRGSDESRARLFVRGKATLAQGGELLAILRDVLQTARLDNRERIRQIVLEEKAAREAALVPSGHSVVVQRMRSRFTEADWAEEQIGGISYLLFLRELARQVDDDWPAVQATLEQLRAALVRRNALVVNVTADHADWTRFAPQLDSFLAELPGNSNPAAAWQPNRPDANEGLSIPAPVNYVGKSANLYQQGYKLHGSALVVSRYLRSSWLWEQVRVRGGAYGGFCLFDPRSGVFGYVSYRDPNLLATLDVYDRSGAFLRALDLSDQELTRAIIGAISDLDAYQLPDARGYTSMIRRLVGDDAAYRQQLRDEVLGTTRADFQAFADVLDGMREHSIVTVMGGEAALQAANEQRPNLLQITKIL
ncbi:MAG TPA: peptidase M16, partial [Roseiflexaceae bacterium]|nr:peptidase M16 [Roseiflexaceae bacterium]